MPTHESDLREMKKVLEIVQAERDAYRRLLYPAFWQQFSEEELRRFATDESVEDAQSLDQFIGEIEEIVNGKLP